MAAIGFQVDLPTLLVPAGLVGILFDGVLMIRFIPGGVPIAAIAIGHTRISLFPRVARKQAMVQLLDAARDQ